MKNQYLGRRKFIFNSLLATGGIVLSTNFISCSDDDDISGEVEIPDDLNQSNFEQGVASFDPSSSQIIIWTRYNTEADMASIVWQLSLDQDFTNVLRSGEVAIDASSDYTLAVEVQNLDADQKLFYRFINVADATVSDVGETITLPINASRVKMAVCSCSNYPAGLFNVYQVMANSDADIIVHLGDYIYEYGAGSYGTNEATAGLARQPEPATEVIQLDEYRRRYKQYRSDADLKLAHQKKPFICVWDDHEIANDAYKNGAENHQASEGDFEVRKMAAIQAYSEYLPVKTTDISLIYRTINIGNLVNLIMLDTRIIGRDKQLDYADFYDNLGVFDAVAFQTAWLDSERTILGATQRDWLINEITGSNLPWQVLGQQVLMGKMLIPAELLGTLSVIVAEVSATGSASAATFALFQQQLQDLTTLKVRMVQGDPTLTAVETARVTTVLPYNLDAWDGYPAEREILYQAFAGKKVVALAGDTHNAWYNNLTDAAGNEVAKEFATSSVTSPGLEGYLGTDVNTVAGFQQAFQLLIDDLNYLNASQRGYVEVTFTQAEATSSWIYVDTITSSSFSATTENTVSYT
ncbi:alkaline phosphatase D family protein [Leeuwenhoekiella sp. A16]|uniref:alkaline phosphatase D family protein n=1 Tax=unclassified Leeuwenhoekiella TaxID=2615029 RepID=UPI003A808D90